MVSIPLPPDQTAPVCATRTRGAAVTRRTLDGAHPEGWIPAEKLTVEQALTAYTATAAYASFEEDTKGTIAPGRLADLVVLDRDLTAIAPEEIANAEVLTTIVGGDVVFAVDFDWLADSAIQADAFHDPSRSTTR